MSTPARKDPTDGHVSAFMAERPRLVGIAYRMLGDVSEAEDIAQEAYLRFAEVPLEEVDRPAAYLTTVTTRLAIDRLRAAQRRRESYVGEWIAEPVLDDPRSAPAPDESALVAESVTLGFLRMLDSLGPTERAVFLLHEVFDLPHAEIARIVNRSEVACRKVASRARRSLEAHRSGRRQVDSAGEEAVLGAFASALRNGDIQGVLETLADEAVATSDGGGKVSAAIRPVRGAPRVARFMVGIARNAPEDWSAVPAWVNGEPAFLVHFGDHLDSVAVFGVAPSGIEHIHIVRNPDKLDALRGGYRLEL